MPVFVTRHRTVAEPSAPISADRSRGRVLERRVAQPEAERKERLPGEVDVVVAAAGRLVVVVERQLAFGHRERDRQPARRVVVAEEHVRDGSPPASPGYHASITAATRSSQRAS